MKAVNDQLRDAYKRAVIISISLMASVLIYVLVAELLRNLSPPWKGIAFSPDQREYSYVRYGLLIIGILSALLVAKISAAVYLSPRRLRNPDQGLISHSAITAAGCDVVATSGLILFLLAGNITDMYLFAGISLGFHVIFFPRYGRWTELAESQPVRPPETEAINVEAHSRSLESEEKKIRGHLESKENFTNEPLFVLKYRRDLKLGIGFICTFFILFFWVCTFELPAKNTSQFVLKPVGAFMIFLCSFVAIDLLLFDETRLYRDRIVKKRHLMGEREIRLSTTALKSRSTAFGSIKNFFRYDSKPYRGWWGSFQPGSIFYAEPLADPKDVKQMNELLAELSGRKVEEFERPIISMPTFYKEDKA